MLRRSTGGASQDPDPKDESNVARQAVPRGGSSGRACMRHARCAALKAFLRTLAGTDVYTDPKWSDPFLRGDS